MGLLTIAGYELREQLYNGYRSLVYRGIREVDSLPVVIKLLKNPYPSFSELVKFRNQYTIAKNLNHPGIIQTYSLETYRNGYTLVMEDFGGISLKDYFINNNHVGCLDEFLEIATDLSNTLDYLMGHGVIHKDIKPANIVINPETKQVKLIDFSIASLLPRETQTLISPNILEGTLGYISPEQTGRINRGIDYRTDFYSLGVTFYELLTQELPFQSEDAMELVYSHIAKMPMALKNREEIPQVLSDIVMKLMAKDASDRYQSALGLKYDLEKCLVQIQETGKIEDFVIAQKDVCARFTIPDKLYGREAEVETVLQGFERVNTGATEMMLVTGFSGIGKTAVVNEVHKPIVRQRGYLIKGKFDQFQRNIPFSAFVQAFRDLMGQLLTESDFHIQQWKNRILDAVGHNGQVIIEVIPELETIIGQQPPTPQLSGIAAQNRFNLLFQKFVHIFTTAEHPLVIFLDDLQWADSASLKLIELLMSESAQGYLLLIGAYRDNEVSAAHPLMLSLAKITKSQATVNTITLNPLSNDSLNQLIADTLSCATEIAQPLTQLVYQKTSGNPFFSRQFLKALYEDGLIKFDYEQGNWQCNTTEVKALAVTDNVVEFMALQLQKLPEDTQSVLRLAACVGNQFDLATLAIISQQSEIETAAALWQALHSGLILPTSEIYKFYIEQSIQDVKPNSQIVNYKFLHDRIQQAAYSLIPPDETAAVHLSIGRLLQKHTNIDERELQLFKIVNQLNRGRSLINDATEREELAHLNKRAGTKARTSSAYDAAMNYLNTGLQLLSPQCWQNQYDLSLELHQLAAEVTYLCGHYDQLTKLLAIGLQQSHHLLDRAKFYEIQVLALIAQHQARAAVDYACKILPNFGVHMPQKPSQLQIILGFFATLYHMSSKTPRDLLKLPPMSDPYKLAAMSLLTVMGSAAAIGMPEILPFTTFKAIPIYLRYGNIPKSSMAYMIYAFLLCERIGRIDAGYAFGKAAIKLCHQTSSREALAPTLFLWNRFIAYRKESLHSLSPLLLEAYEISLEVGNLEYAAYNLCVYFAQTFFIKQNLVDLALEAITSRLAIQKLQQSVMVMLQDLCCQIMENLITAPDDVCQLVGRFFDETVVQDREVQVYTSLFKTLLAFWFNRYELAIEQAAIVEKLLGNLDGTFFKTLFYFYDALLSLAVYPDLTSARQKVALAKVKTTRQRLAVLAKSAPMNYHHQQLLLEAEYLRVLGKLSQAIDFYDRSISGAKENGYIQQEALANELAAKFYLDWGKQKVAQTYMQQAYYCYARWGALAKIRDLEKRYPQLLNTILQSASASSLKGSSTTIQATASNSSSNISSLLDLDTIVKISQSFTSEIHLERLVEQVMQAVVSNAGADKGALILNDQNILTVVSQYVNSQV
ncbi:ATP-binding protein, partial [Aetokthonos hydrillicola]